MLQRVRFVWPRAVVPTGENLRDLDKNTTSAVDGRGGGTYSPSSPIVIGGSGLVILTKSKVSNLASVVISGTKRLKFGKGTSDDALRLGAGHSDRSRALLRNIDEVWSATGDAALLIEVQAATAQVQTPGARFFASLRVFDGAQLDTVTFRWRVGTAHAGVPEHLPRFRVIRVSTAGVLEPLRAEDSTTDRDGWQVWGPRPASGANYYNSGALKTLTYGCNQANRIARASFEYFAEVEDERGSNAWVGSGDGNFYHSTVSQHSAIERLTLRQ